MREFDLIRKIRDQFKTPPEVKCGIGDDCAVIDPSMRLGTGSSMRLGTDPSMRLGTGHGDKYELVTMDMLVQDDHFKLEWSSPFEIGWKAMQASVSDIAAMGGKPKYGFVSLCLSKRVDEKWVLELYRGMEESLQGNVVIASGPETVIASGPETVIASAAKTVIPSGAQRSRGISSRHPSVSQAVSQAVSQVDTKIPILGGDITHGQIVVIDVCLIGEVEKERLVLRSGAQVGDLICVSGTLGASWAGLEYLRMSSLREIVAPQQVVDYCLLKHKQPRSRLELAPTLSKYVSAMIDISDGLASEVRHIAEGSGVGAVIYKEKIPLDSRVIEMAKGLNKDPYDWALSGGEDFELLFTISKEKFKELVSEDITIFAVGEILEASQGIVLMDQGVQQEMPRGYEHFEDAVLGYLAKKREKKSKKYISHEEVKRRLS